ncbi:serine hydrolase [Roseiconus lacunae]|uniref:serine hydrolase n=1 Tax=Roseiconus lacunae TaxID=2605694 RepID=UPI00308E38AC|nr:serine hydrolase [Stieleria sp. HD01]
MMLCHNRCPNTANRPSRILFVVLVLSMVVPAVGRAQETQPRLGAKVAELRRKHDVPALAVIVVNKDGVVESNCSGDRKRGASDRAELSDRFAIGSNTKSMTATLAAVLVEAGQIEWSTTLGEVWPKATDEHLHPKLRDVTLDELLSHQSGIAVNISDVSRSEWARFFAEKESPALERRRMLRIVLPKAPASPRGQFVYSNLGYAIAASMLETRAGRSFETLMKELVFEPLEMRSADFRTLESAEKSTPPLLWGHDANGKPVDPRAPGAENPSVYASCGTVHLSVEDYAKYACWHLAGKPSPVLKTQATFDHLHEPLIESTPGNHYACGWICAPTPLGSGLNHGGSNTNSFALIWVIPEADLAAIVCTNTGEPQAFPACDEMMGYLFARHGSGQKQTDAGEMDSKPGTIAPERLAGRYQLTPNFIFDVKYEGGRMMVGITNQPTQQVYADSPTKWSYKSVEATLEFHVRSKGPAYALTLHQNGIKQQAKRIGN